MLREFLFMQSSFFDCENQKLREEVTALCRFNHSASLDWVTCMIIFHHLLFLVDGR